MHSWNTTESNSTVFVCVCNMQKLMEKNFNHKIKLKTFRHNNHHHYTQTKLNYTFYIALSNKTKQKCNPNQFEQASRTQYRDFSCQK